MQRGPASHQQAFRQPRAHPPASQTTSRQSVSLTAANHNPADAVNSRNHPKVAKSLTFIPARVRKWQSYTVFGIVSQRSEARQAVCSVTLSCFSLRGRRYRMGESAHCRNRFASLEQRRLLERGILLRHGRLHRARGQRHVAAIRQPMPAVREIGPRHAQPPHGLLRTQHQRHAVMNRRNDCVRAGGHHREAGFVPHARKQQRCLVFGAETISTLGVPARFRTANRLRRVRFEEAARGHHAAPARYRPRPHARVRPHRFLQARVIHRALRPLSSKSPGQTRSGKHTARIGNNHVNRRPRNSIRWHRASSPNQTSRPIGHHVNRRDRLKHANNVRNLVPTQNLKPPTHRKSSL